MKNTILAIGCAALILSCTENDKNASRKLDGENAGGETTVFVQTSQAFGFPALIFQPKIWKNIYSKQFLKTRFLPMPILTIWIKTEFEALYRSIKVVGTD